MHVLLSLEITQESFVMISWQIKVAIFKRMIKLTKIHYETEANK